MHIKKKIQNTERQGKNKIALVFRNFNFVTFNIGIHNVNNFVIFIKIISVNVLKNTNCFS